MKFLLTNDDGIDAAGLEALVARRALVGEPVVVAPGRPAIGREPRRHLARRRPDRAAGRAAFCDSRHAGRLHPARPAPSRAGSEMDPERDQSWLEPGRGCLLFRARWRRCAKRSCTAGRGSRFPITARAGSRFDWDTRAALDHADPGRSAGAADRAGCFLQCQPAGPAAGRARSGSRLVPARSQTASAQLPARGRKRTLFRGRIPPARIAPRARTSMSVSAATLP